jgi:hypothetical protein
MVAVLPKRTYSKTGFIFLSSFSMASGCIESFDFSREYNIPVGERKERDVPELFYVQRTGPVVTTSDRVQHP